MTGFAAGEERWRARLGTLGQVVRQELVSRQLAAQLPPRAPLRVLDVDAARARRCCGSHGTGTT